MLLKLVLHEQKFSVIKFVAQACTL